MEKDRLRSLAHYPPGVCNRYKRLRAEDRLGDYLPELDARLYPLLLDSGRCLWSRASIAAGLMEIMPVAQH